jgi:peptidyl-dipeptidase A
MTPSRRATQLVPALAAAFAIAVALTAADGLLAQSGDRPDDAGAFLARVEPHLNDLSIRAGRAGWVQSTFITHDTEILAAEANERFIAATTEYANEAARFRTAKLAPDLDRKIRLLRLALTMPAPANDAERAELTRLASSLEADYGRGKYCRGTGADPGKDCLDIGAIERVMAESRDPKALVDVWVGWRTIAPPMRDRYTRFVELMNKGARELGFDDVGAMWRSNYDMPPDRFEAELERLWTQVRPLYESLHAYVRRRLSEHYGPTVVPPAGPIPAHLLGNPWAQQWGNVYPLVAPPGDARHFDLTELLKNQQIDERRMVKLGEGFFTSLGFAALPEMFWERSLFTKPRDRDVVCHASAWTIDNKDDVRLKMCIQIRGEDFVTVHHELGHNFYQRAYNGQPYLFQGSANDGFHEALGDTIALSVTPEYLKTLGLLDQVPAASADIGLLLDQALDKIAFLPFGLMIDQWRWRVFSGAVPASQYNAAWWELRRKYQGVAAPVARSERDFDPGAKYHVPANFPYTRYFLAHILQFQFHRALCEAAGQKGPLHRCSIYDSKEAGRRLQKMMEMGLSQPWPDALEALTGQREMDATAILDYFAPLKRWLDEQNKGQPIGW